MPIRGAGCMTLGVLGITRAVVVECKLSLGYESYWSWEGGVKEVVEEQV